MESLARWLGFDRDLDRWFTLEPAEAGSELKVMFPTPCTLRRALLCYCDTNGPPSKQLVSYLASYASSIDAKTDHRLQGSNATVLLYLLCSPSTAESRE